MARLEDSPGLFGSGSCCSTLGNISCDWCGTNYTGRENEEGEGRLGNESIDFVHFGGLQICGCCFEEVERTILREMPNILPWFIRILKARRSELEKMEDMLVELAKLLRAQNQEA